MTSALRVRRPFAILAWGLLFPAFSLLVYSLAKYPLVVNSRILVLALLMILAENYSLDMPGYGVSVAYPMMFAMTLVGGPSATLVIALLVSVSYQEMRMKLPLSVHAFNVGQIMTSNGLAALMYVALGGRVLTAVDGSVTPISSADFPELVVPLLALVAVGALGNISLLALGYAYRHQVKTREVLGSLGWAPPAQFALAGVGILLAQVLAANVLALPLFVFPLFIARQFYQRFIALQDAYTQTLRSLVTGLEAKDPYTRGHSERVAGYSVMLAEAYGMSEKQVRDIETAALLHDLGKLSISGSILRKPGKLDAEEWLAIKRHPTTGASMVQRIPHLKGLADAVACHHERLDGSGYPNGTLGNDIPFAARLMAIADSYDAMTTDRPYRPGFSASEAVAELRECSGRLYDLELVEAFAQGLRPVQESALEADGPPRTGPIQGADAL